MSIMTAHPQSNEVCRLTTSVVWFPSLQHCPHFLLHGRQPRLATRIITGLQLKQLLNRLIPQNKFGYHDRMWTLAQAPLLTL